VGLSDRTIRRLLDEGRIGIDPYDEGLLQPSSVDVRVDRFFRVFHNNRYPYIDVREPQEELTEPAETPYGTGELGSKYQGQRGPTPSRYWQNFERETVG
jgi:deoxycytidine triphosphate deaminase